MPRCVLDRGGGQRTTSRKNKIRDPTAAHRVWHACTCVACGPTKATETVLTRNRHARDIRQRPTSHMPGGRSNVRGPTRLYHPM
eukprot:5513771-Prymnesium_polylepis.6